MQAEDRFDHVVVGAGSAGCALAARQHQPMIAEKGGDMVLADAPDWMVMFGVEDLPMDATLLLAADADRQDLAWT